MPKPSVETLLADPDFQTLDIEGKREILSDVSESFKGLSPERQTQALTEIGQLSAPSAPIVDPRAVSRLAKDQALNEREALGQEFVRQEQRPTLEKAIQGALGTGQALIQPVISIARGIGGIPEVAADPSRILPTAAEASRRVGMDINSLARALPGLIYRYGTLPGNIQRLGALAPRTPSQQEVQAFLEQQPLEQEIQKERETVAFQGAQPELAEAVTQAIELAPPIRGVQVAAKGINVAKAPVERILRAATKPPKQIAGRLEASIKNTIPDIYHAAPNADALGSMPLEGFQQTVNQVKKSIGAEIDEGLKQIGTPLTAGDEMAAALNARADKLARAGQPEANVQVLRDRATDLTGKATDMESLRDAVTAANRENGPLFTRTREAANPLRAQAETIANEIISKVGGEIENKALKSIKGPAGETLRKKWSDLSLVEKQASDQLNKIINQAPPEIQSRVVEALTSPEGIAGLFALTQGYLSGALGLVSGGVKSWSRNFNKAARDSNALITSAYEKLRANPPAEPRRTLPATPIGTGTSIPPSPQDLNAILQRTLEDQAAERAASTIGFF